MSSHNARQTRTTRCLTFGTGARPSCVYTTWAGHGTRFVRRNSGAS